MTTKKPNSSAACALQPYEWMLIAASLAKRWPIQTFSSHTMAFVSREVWMDAQREVLAADRVLTRFNLSSIRAHLVDVVCEMKVANQKASAPFVRTFNVPEPFVTRSEAREIAKSMLMPEVVKVRGLRVMVLGVIAAQERRLVEDFPDVDFKFVAADHVGRVSTLNAGSYEVVLGLVGKMNHSMEALVAPLPQYVRVNGAYTSLTRTLSNLINEKASS